MPRVFGARMERFVSALLFFLVLVSPRFASARPLLVSPEDAVLDGDLDAEDLVANATVGRALPPAGSEGTWVSLLGLTRRTPGGAQEIGGFVVVGLPLDRVARAPARPRDSLAPSLVSSWVPASAASPMTEPQGPRFRPDEGPLLTPKIARACVFAALRAAGLGADDLRLDGVLSRARWSAVLPEARLRAVRFDDARLSTDTTVDSSRLRDSTGANMGLEARLTWRLDRLLYADDEPAFERMKLDRVAARARVAGRVLDALFHWQRAWIELKWSQHDSREESEAAARMVEAEATLDVLTAGWFSSHRRGLGVREIEVVAPARN